MSSLVSSHQAGVVPGMKYFHFMAHDEPRARLSDRVPKISCETCSFGRWKAIWSVHWNCPPRDEDVGGHGKARSVKTGPGAIVRTVSVTILRPKLDKPLPKPTVTEVTAFKQLPPSPIEGILPGEAQLSRAGTICTTTNMFFTLLSSAELPGSLLLPSQGFPQHNPPVTPPKQIIKRKPVSSSSVISPIPVFNSPLPTTPENEEMARRFGSPGNRAAQVDRGSISSGSHLTTNKSFLTMNLDELLDRLPNLKIDVIKGIWLQSARRACEQFKDFLHNSGKVNLASHNELKDFGEHLKLIAEGARDISLNYEKAVRSAESLIEGGRDQDTETVDNIEHDLAEAHGIVEENNYAIYMRDQNIRQLTQSLKFLVGSVQSYVNVVDHASDVDASQHQAIKQVLADYNGLIATDGAETPRYVRVLEDAYLSDLSHLREKKASIVKFRDVVNDQAEVIKDQSRKLDGLVTRLEKCVATITDRDGEISALVQKREQLEQVISDYENGLILVPGTKDEFENLQRSQDELQRQLTSLKSQHERELSARDVEIATLRSKLERAIERLGGRNVNGRDFLHQGTTSSTQDHSGSHLNLANQVTRGLLKMTPRDRTRKPHPHYALGRSLGHFPNSMSLTNLPFFPSKASLAAESFTTQTESEPPEEKEPGIAAAVSVPTGRLEPRPARVQNTSVNTAAWACGLPGSLPGGNAPATRKRSNSDGLVRDRDSYPDLAPRPRTDSLGAMGLYNLMQPSKPLTRSKNNNATPRPVQQPMPSPLNTFKDLPPMPGQDGDDNDSPNKETVASYLDKPTPYDGMPLSSHPPSQPFAITSMISQTYADTSNPARHMTSTNVDTGCLTSFQPQYPSMSPHKRVLSLIPEGSIEDFSSDSTPDLPTTAEAAENADTSSSHNQSSSSVNSTRREALRIGLATLTRRGPMSRETGTFGRGIGDGVPPRNSSFRQAQVQSMRVAVPENVTIQRGGGHDMTTGNTYNPASNRYGTMSHGANGNGRGEEMMRTEIVRPLHGNGNEEGSTDGSENGGRDRSPVRLSPRLAQMYPAWHAAVFGQGRV